jgi:hypothetical protein
MKITPNALGFSGALLAVGLMGGCATGASDSGSMFGMSRGHTDMQTMCEMHKSMMAGKSTAEQQAIMNEHMKSQSPEMQVWMQAMHDKCKDL